MKASVLELAQLTDSATTKKVWVVVTQISTVSANVNNTYDVRMQDGKSFSIDQTNFNLLKNQGFEIP